jgi:hypothetical protein
MRENTYLESFSLLYISLLSHLVRNSSSTMTSLCSPLFLKEEEFTMTFANVLCAFSVQREAYLIETVEQHEHHVDEDLHWW